MADKPQWLIREDAGVPVLVALALRQQLGIRVPEDLPALRDLPVRTPDAADATLALETQWRDYWNMTVEPAARWNSSTDSTRSSRCRRPGPSSCVRRSLRWPRRRSSTPRPRTTATWTR